MGLDVILTDKKESNVPHRYPRNPSGIKILSV